MRGTLVAQRVVHASREKSPSSRRLQPLTLPLRGARSPGARSTRRCSALIKEICAQCLQRHRDPVTGTETVVFSCFNQDQEMDRVDFRTLRRRLSQNSVQEKLTKLWVDRCLQHLGERPAIAAE